jgi:hypothetical protein
VQIDITKPISTLTAEEFAEARKQCLPIHCQTMVRRSNVNAANYVFSDIEELTKENLDKRVQELMRKGWRLSGTYFIRQPKPKQ